MNYMLRAYFGHLYSVTVRFNCKFLLLAMSAALMLLGAGCSGINQTHSISPASFFLPGLMQKDSQPSQPDVTVPDKESAKLVAQAD